MWNLALLNNGDVVDVVGGNCSEGSGSNLISITESSFPRKLSFWDRCLAFIIGRDSPIKVALDARVLRIRARGTRVRGNGPARLGPAVPRETSTILYIATAALPSSSISHHTFPAKV